jgi:hypothetical protein
LINPGVFRVVAGALRIPTWKLALGIAIAIAAALALVLLATGLFLVLFPLVLVGIGLSRLFGGGGRSVMTDDTPAGAWQPVRYGQKQARVIEVDYQVIGPDRRDDGRR